MKQTQGAHLTAAGGVAAAWVSLVAEGGSVGALLTRRGHVVVLLAGCVRDGGWGSRGAPGLGGLAEEEELRVKR